MWGELKILVDTTEYLVVRLPYVNSTLVEVSFTGDDGSRRVVQIPVEDPEIVRARMEGR